MQPFQELLHVSDIRCKLERLDANCQKALVAPESLSVPAIPARDVAVLAMRELPPKPGLSTAEGQARLLCDLASIELQAMEMGLRTLIEFPAAPSEFREQLVLITKEEGSHLRLCLNGLEELGFPWGLWPVHIALWECLSREDSLLDRILIVHRYLEGSGLDAGEAIRRLNNLSSAEDFPRRLNALHQRLPRRLEPLDWGLRSQAGFTCPELEALARLQNTWR